MSVQEVFEPFKYQEKLAVEILSRAWEGNKLSHAYLFISKSSEKALEFIKAFSKIILCEHKDACNKCISCRVFNSGQHPDYRVWSPESEKSKQIKIEQIREIIAANQVRPITSKTKVLILDQAQNMNDPSANALLKTLEEPNPFTTLILISDSIDSILSTILSRCQIIPIKGTMLALEKTSFDFSTFIPKTYSEASEMALKASSLEKDELTKFIYSLQQKLWASLKEYEFHGYDFDRTVYLMEKLEKYLIEIEKYVNVKMITENLFIELLESKKILELLK
jgi:DNA polymerase-3 subunit delta'